MEEGMICQALCLKAVDAGSYSPLALAYIGDAVYEVLIRTRVMNQGNMQVRAGKGAYTGSDHKAAFGGTFSGGNGCIQAGKECQISYHGKACYDDRVSDGYRI